MPRTQTTLVQKRFSDIDSFHHVNNVSQQMYFDLGKVEYYDNILGSEVLIGRLRIITVSTSTSYMGQIRFKDDIRVTTTCEKVGTKSIVLFQRIFCGDEIRTESRSVMVAFDFEAQESVSVPEHWREQLLRD